MATMVAIWGVEEKGLHGQDGRGGEAPWLGRRGAMVGAEEAEKTNGNRDRWPGRMGC